MLAALMQLFSSDGYMPHGMCLLWETGLLRLHIWSDALIGISYFSMPIALLYFARKRPDFAFSWVLVLFGIFILACGTTHFFSIWTLWHPTYVLDGLVKALTAAASIPTAILLWLIMPQALALPNLRQLGALNAALQGQITERQLSEIALTDANTKLQEATAKLSHSEREARALNARLSLGTQAGGIGVWDYDIQARAFWWDDRMCDLYGVSKDAATNDYQTWLSRLHADDRQRAEAVFAEALETGQSYEAEYRIIWPNGDVRTLRTNGKRSTDEAGQSPHLVGVCYDVTDLRQKELAAEREGAKRASERFQRVVEAAPNAMVLVSAAGSIEMVNTEAERVFGYSRPALLGRSIEILLPDRLNTQHVTQRQNFLANPTPRRIGAGGELFACRKNGEEFPVEIGLSPIETEEGRMVLASVVDVTERRRTMEELERRAVALNTEVAQRRVIELELRETSENFRYLFQHSPLPMWVFDIGDFRFLEVNDAAVLQYGFSRDEFLTMSILDIRPAEEQSRLKQNLATETAAYQQSTNWRHRRKNGEIIQVDIFTHALLFEGRSARMTVAIDVTKRNQAEEQLRQAQKMDAMGQLTGGISHDFNNLLAIIQGNVELIADHVAADPAVMEMAADVLKATERGATLTQQLLAYSRQQPLEPRVLILGKTIADLTTMLVRLLGETIQVETNVAADLWKVRIDPHQLENALLNLALNARDAMPTGGKLTIEARNTTLDEHYAAENADVTPGNYVLVAVSDTGSGMSSETIGRAFEPFFTTKAVGRGTGLGLSMVYGFVKQSGGHIKIYSELTHGTSIKLYLPSATENVAAQEITEMDGQVPQSMSGEVVLVVEDDAAVRKLAVRLLIGLGYQTIEAEDGPNALVVLENTQRIDLLFTDVVMPKGMSGPVLAREAQLRRPGLKVLYMSGYTRDAMLHNGEVSEGIHLISKPFRKVELATKLRQILDGQDAD